ncbi:MAG: thioesterase family protein [Gemmatimonadales bacterium]
MPHAIELTVYPDECDTFGHLNQASYFALFERARWELLRRGAGMDLFTKAGVWPAVRKASVEYHAGTWPGDVLRFGLEMTQRGRTSFTLRQTATRTRDSVVVATLESLFVCVDKSQRAVTIPDEVAAAFGPDELQLSI